MSTEIASALIGAAAAIAVALLTVYRDEIGGLLLGSRRFSYLKGNWRCTWDVAASETAPARQVQDQVTIESARGSVIRGKGVDADFGEYAIKGEASEFAVTLSYCGLREKRLLRGVIILKPQSPTVLGGVWCQLSADGTLKSGATTWTKI